MSTVNPFVVSILSKLHIHPLQAAASVSGQTFMDMPVASTYDTISASQFEPCLNNTQIVFSELIIPQRHLPIFNEMPVFLQLRKGANKQSVAMARNTLWQKINWREKRQDAQFARLIELHCPSALNQKDLIDTGCAFAQYLADQGMVVDIALHQHFVGANDDAEKQTLTTKHSIQLMCTTRTFENGMFGNKERQWNQKETMIAWRAKWFELLVPLLEKNPDKTLAKWRSFAYRFAPQNDIITLDDNCDHNMEIGSSYVKPQTVELEAKNQPLENKKPTLRL